MEISNTDKSVVRRLAEKVAEIAALPVHKGTAAEWRRLNGLGKGRPLVWINEIPWHEISEITELALQTTDPFCRWVEWCLRSTIYQWKNARGDMVVEPVFYSPLVIHDTGFGIETQEHLIPQDERGGILAHAYHPQINDEKDLDKIRTPEVTHDEEASERNYQVLSDLVGDVLTVRKRGILQGAIAPWDELVQWWGVQQVLTDLVIRPELVHHTMDRLLTAYLGRLKQWEEMNLLDIADGNYRVGSGGLGYTDELPQPDFDPHHIRPCDQWGYCTAQIFDVVSPRMHQEFALQYEKRWLARFGLTYYGCCDALHHKVEILKSVPNLRKISMGPTADLEKAAPLMGCRYVVSYKPSPAVFATDDWDAKKVRADLVESLKKVQGCVVEVIMKDISTIRDDPHRLREWAAIAMDVAGQFA